LETRENQFDNMLSVWTSNFSDLDTHPKMEISNSTNSLTNLCHIA